MTTTGTMNKELVEKIKSEVLSRYENTKDPSLRKAVQQWLDEHYDPRKPEPVGELYHTILSPELIEAAIAWHQADIEENAAINRLRMAQLRVREANYRFRSLLAEVEGVCVTSDELYVNIPRMEVWRSDPEQLKRILPRRVVDFCKRLASGDYNGNDLKKGYIPNEFKELQVLTDFVTDIVDFLEAHGAKGNELIVAICTNLALAQEMAEDDNAPTPIRFLSKSVCSVDGMKSTNKSKGPIGFREVKQMY